MNYVTVSQNPQAAVGEEVEEARDLLQEKEERENEKSRKVKWRRREKLGAIWDENKGGREVSQGCAELYSCKRLRKQDRQMFVSGRRSESQ